MEKISILGCMIVNYWLFHDEFSFKNLNNELKSLCTTNKRLNASESFFFKLINSLSLRQTTN